jgi:hypothetical protein
MSRYQSFTQNSTNNCLTRKLSGEVEGMHLKEWNGVW